MKKIAIIKLVILIAIVTSTIGCKKEEINVITSQNSVDNITVNPVVLPTISPNILGFIENIDTDAQDKKVDKALYYFSKALSNVCLDNDRLNELMTLTENEEHVTFDYLINSSNLGGSIIDELSNMNQNYNTLLDLMIKNGTQYYPVVEFANKHSDNSRINTSNFVIAAGFGYEHYTRSDSLQSFIPGWTINSDTLITVIIDEHKNDSISVPVFVVQNHTDSADAWVEFEPETVPESPFVNKTNKSNNSVFAFNVDAACTGFKITERYETDKRSCVTYTENVLEGNAFKGFGIGYELKNVHKNDVNKEIYPNPPTDISSQGVDVKANYYMTAYVTYEYDWYASKKTVVVNTPYATVYAKSCKMKFNYEWYVTCSSARNTHLRYNGKGFFDVRNRGAI